MLVVNLRYKRMRSRANHSVLLHEGLIHSDNIEFTWMVQAMWQLIGVLSGGKIS